jgi:hypothetical protein
VGTLTSVPFKVTHRWASFLVGGGPWKDDVRRTASSEGKVFTRVALEGEDMQREVSISSGTRTRKYRFASSITTPATGGMSTSTTSNSIKTSRSSRRGRRRGRSVRSMSSRTPASSPKPLPPR